jgi:hypothetical protein
MNGKQSHYYIYQGERYENMQQCREAHGLGRAGFRKLVKNGIIEKVIINDVKPQGDAQNKTTTQTELQY